jgi:glycopeptide antibiotics resistance protein
MTYILEDLKAAATYIPIGLAVAFLLIGLRFAMTGKGCRRSSGFPRRLIVEYIFSVYIVTMLSVAFFSREPGSRDSLSLIPFSTWGNTVKAHAYVIENVLMYIPWGIFLPMIWERAKNMGICILAAFSSSLALEILQSVTKRGYGQTDDVLMNTLGALIGYGMWKCVRIVFDRDTTKYP